MLCAPFVEQLSQKQRLDCRRQLGDVVDARQGAGSPRGRDRCRSAGGNRSADLPDRPCRFSSSIKENHERSIRMVRKERVGEHTGIREVVARDDGADVQH